MKISEYPLITSVSEDQVFLIDGANGTKRILATDAILAALSLLSIKNRRMIIRGKNLGNSLTQAQKTAIQNGTFEDLYLGDYWVIGGVNWRIVDFDYWYGTGDSKFTSHHLVIMPDKGLYSANMNASSTTTGGYTGSQMYTSGLQNAKTTISSAFGSAVLSHREYMITTVANGAPSAGSYTDSTVELPNEPMIYGSYIYCAGSNGTTDIKRYTNSKTQLALFAADPSFIICDNGFWLRDIALATHFCRVDGYGGATSTGAANSYPVRPVFAIG